MLLRLLSSKAISELNTEHLQSYVLWLVTNKSYSEARVHTTINAIKFYFEKVKNRPHITFDLPRPKKPEQLPKVHDSSCIVKMIKCTENIKHRTMLMMAYSSGLRLNEIICLRISDIDSARMVISVRRGKGKKDRQALLSVKMLEQLRAYYRIYKPTEYLFEGVTGGQYGYRSLQEVFKQAKERAGINFKGGIHTLRHSFATHLHENGTDIRLIQELLGHSNIETTMRYTHVSRRQLQNIISPLDNLDL